MTDSMSRPRVGCSSSMTLAPGLHQGQQRALLVAAGEGLHRAGRRPLDVVLGDALLGQPAAALPVDEEAGLLLGEEEVLGEDEAGDEALLQAGGGHVGHALPLEVVVGLAREVGVLAGRPGRRWSGPGRRRRAGRRPGRCPPCRRGRWSRPGGPRGRAGSSLMRPCSALMPVEPEEGLAGGAATRARPG